MVSDALVVSGLTKSFGATRALDGLNLRVVAGEVRALLGENGSGKSTFIKTLSGFHEPDPGGTVTVEGEVLAFGNPEASRRLGLRFVHQDLALVDKLSITDNFFLGSHFPTTLGTISPRRARDEVKRALESVGLDADPRTTVGELAAAERTGVAIARAVHGLRSAHARVLVLDEPTATLPDEDVNRLLDTVRAVSARGIAVLYVTHRLDEVFRVADSATVLRDGREVLTTPVADLTLEDLIRHLGGDQQVRPGAATAAARIPGAPVLQVDALVTGRLRGVSLTASAGEVVGIAGLTGSGRDEFCAAVFGASERAAGQVRIGGKVIRSLRPTEAIAHGTGYVPANRRRDASMPYLSARENVSISRIGEFWKFPAIRRAAEKMSVSGWFQRLNVRPPDGVEREFRTFSGGNQQKLVFARWLRREPRLILADDPTQGVDIGTRALLHRQLVEAAERGTAVVIASADAEELAAVSSRVLVVRNGRFVTELRGDEISVSEVSRHLVNPKETQEGPTP